MITTGLLIIILFFMAAWDYIVGFIIIALIISILLTSWVLWSPSPRSKGNLYKKQSAAPWEIRSSHDVSESPDLPDAEHSNDHTIAPIKRSSSGPSDLYSDYSSLPAGSLTAVEQIVQKNKLNRFQKSLLKRLEADRLSASELMIASDFPKTCTVTRDFLLTAHEFGAYRSVVAPCREAEQQFSKLIADVSRVSKAGNSNPGDVFLDSIDYMAASIPFLLSEAECSSRADYQRFCRLEEAAAGIMKAFHKLEVLYDETMNRIDACNQLLSAITESSRFEEEFISYYLVPGNTSSEDLFTLVQDAGFPIEMNLTNYFLLETVYVEFLIGKSFSFRCSEKVSGDLSSWQAHFTAALSKDFPFIQSGYDLRDDPEGVSTGHYDVLSDPKKLIENRYVFLTEQYEHSYDYGVLQNTCSSNVELRVVEEMISRKDVPFLASGRRPDLAVLYAYSFIGKIPESVWPAEAESLKERFVLLKQKPT